MNKNRLKSYAPAARRDFIRAVTDRAHFFGLSETQITPVVESGDVAIIGGRPFLRTVAAQRKKLEERVKRDGFNQVMEAIAYTWFNRFLALRYMELHGYMEHGFRVLSNSGSSTVPEILDHAAQVDLPGLNKQKVVELKLDGSKDAELYRLLLVAQCNALHAAMPFLFEKIDDETELLLPDNLLHSDSLISRLVTEIEEEDWREVEIIGWLYQFYISEKKDQVIGKVVKSEDIPAATQLFTPNWIVKYMVQNSLGRKWLDTYPESPLKAKMEYYIEPAEQTDEVTAQLSAITPDSLDPEKLTLLDPACGSGHILVEAYDIFKAIYLERGYIIRDIPRLILEKNLFGLDIDDRAAQMAGFALMMKARKDDRRILRSDSPVKLNVMAIQESGDIVIENAYWAEHTNALKDLVDLFRHGKTFGSLIQVPEQLAKELPTIEHAVKQALTDGDLYSYQVAGGLISLVKQTKILTGKYDCVVANPPYMGGKGMNTKLKDFAKKQFPDSKSDLFAMFIERGFDWCGVTGFNAMVTMQSWMFLSSFEAMREKLIAGRTIITMAHLGSRAFGEISGEVVQTTSFILYGKHINAYRPSFFRLVKGQEEQKEAALRSGANRFDEIIQDELKKIPGCPIAYWLKGTHLFEQKTIGDMFVSGGRNKTHDNEKYLRFFWEVAKNNPNWISYANGGGFRKYAGNELQVVDWSNKARSYYESQGGLCNPKFWGKEGVTWSLITAGINSFRIKPEYSQYSSGSPTIFNSVFKCDNKVLAFLNTPIARYYLTAINPTLNTTVSDVFALPFIGSQISELVSENVKTCISLGKIDWDSFEISLYFTGYSLLQLEYHQPTMKGTYYQARARWLEMTLEMQRIEEENNHIFIEAYGLQSELTPEVALKEVTLTCNPHYRYGDGKAEEELEALLLADTLKELISYAIGCMMGRYSLDQPGLVYANSGNIGFDPSKYQTFLADDDGIIPVKDVDWFPDDATNRFEEFLKIAWAPETLEENLRFVADSLSPKGGETPRETIRRYISTQFYKDHLQTYKKRPIYWLFSSGKQRAFECLVYLHRYKEATLSRMRNEYVTPLQGKFSAQAEYLSNAVSTATSTAERNRLQKQLDTMRKKQTELAAFDDLLRHYADQRISLDLDDGVKVNYGKFGGLLTEIKSVTGEGE